MSDAELTTLGKYQISRTLGRGAMGVVYEGFDPIISRRVAIKTVQLDRVDEGEGAEDLQRFKREAQAAGRLTHPNIVGVYDYGEADRIAYIVMEFVEGDSLRALIDRGERFTPDAAISMMQSLLTGLAYSHENGVIHRDIKPANVMITRDGRVKLADFGVARIESSSLTQAGTMIGTPSYMSPEQFVGHTIDARTDIYSAGVLFYQLLTGEKPFEGSVTAVMHKVLNTEPPAPSALSVTVPIALDQVVRRAMAKRPEDRFATARSFADALRALDTTPDADTDATRIIPAVPAAALAKPDTTGTKITKSAGQRRVAMLAGSFGAGIIGAILFVALRPSASTVPNAAYLTANQRQSTVATVAKGPPPDATLQARLAAAIAPVDCVLLHGTITPNGATLSGIAAADTLAPLRLAISRAVNPAQATLAVRRFTAPYCGVIGALRADAPLFVPPAARLRLRLAHHATRLASGQHIVVDLDLPNFAGYAEVDYISSSGAVYRLYPSPATPAAFLPAGTHLVLGNAPAARWAVGAPYGRDMIVALASATPIITLPQSQFGTIATLLPALQGALARRHTQKIKVVAAAILLDTVKK